ncbi:Uma2 family endonuclease [Streptomyces boninensis]|uniref:Uma2 family endonuclease n=1 Tax=Streptomyces boninensis TaxID=2039455 RepID=UPI003B21F8A1
MTSVTEEYDRLRKAAEALPPMPPLTYPEISRGELHMMMSPSGRHEWTARLIRRQLDEQMPEGLVAETGGDVEDRRLGILRRPDVLVTAPEAFDTDGPLTARDIIMAIEVVSPSNPGNDYDEKVHEYPAMGITHYVIVDPREGKVTHYWSPVGTEVEEASYENVTRHRFGAVVQLGDWTLDTSELPRYGTGAGG